MNVPVDFTAIEERLAAYRKAGNRTVYARKPSHRERSYMVGSYCAMEHCDAIGKFFAQAANDVDDLLNEIRIRDEELERLRAAPSKQSDA